MAPRLLKLHSMLYLIGLIAAGAPLTLKQVVDEALSQAPELAAAAHAHAAAKAQVGLANTAYLPRIAVDVSYLLHYPKNKLPIELPDLPGLDAAVNDIDDFHRFSGGLSVAYRLFDFSRSAMVESAEARAEASRLDRTALRAKLAFSARLLFLRALFSKRIVEITSASLQVAQREVRRAALRVEHGAGSQTAHAQAKVRAAGLSAQLLRAQANFEQYTDELRILLNRETNPEISGDLATLAANLQVKKLSDFEQHPELQSLSASARAAEAVATSSARSIVPSISLQGSVSAQYPRALKLELGPVFQLGVQLSWPVFEGMSRWRKVEVQEAQSKAISAQKDAVARRLERKRAALNSKARSAVAALSAAREVLEHTGLYLRVATAAVEAGTGTQLDVHNAQLGLDKAKTEVQNALLQQALIGAEALMVEGLAFSKEPAFSSSPAFPQEGGDR